MRISMQVPVIAALVLLAVPVAGQAILESEPGSSVRTRDDLERLASFYEEVLASPAYSDRMKNDAEASLTRVRTRLEQGDFRVGDRIVLSVQGEPTVPDTVAVETGPQVVLPLFGSISLAGVLRSEIEPHLTRELSRFINNPVVRAQGLMRLSVQGQVARPGFYVVPADMLVSDAIMTAGGPGGGADLESLRIERGTEVVVGGQELQDAMRDGWTLDQLNLQAGDQLFLPAEGGGVWGTVGQVALGAIPGLIIALLIGRRN